MSKHPGSPRTSVPAARAVLLVVLALALAVVFFVVGAVLGAVLFGPTQPDAPTLPFGLGGDGPPDAVLVAPVTAELSDSTDSTDSRTSAAANESAPSPSNEPSSPEGTGRPLPPAD